MKTHTGNGGNKRGHNSAPSEPNKARHQVSDTVSSGRQTVDESGAAKNYKTMLPSYRFQRSRTPGIIEVLNENSYVMAEYSERTGSVKWQRMVLASQRERIEKWLDDHYLKT